MAAKYWYVANNGNSNWNTSGAWYDVPGGPPNGGVAIGVPTINDEAYLDGESGSGTLTIVAGSVCYSLDCTNFTGTLAGGSAFQVAGNFFLSPSMTFTHFGTLTLGSVSYPGSYVLLLEGKTFLGNVTINGPGSYWQFYDFKTVSTATVTFTSGAFDASSYSYTQYSFECGLFVSTGSGVRYMWTNPYYPENWNITGSGTVWSVQGTNITCYDTVNNLQTATVEFTNSSNLSKTISHLLTGNNYALAFYIMGNGTGSYILSSSNLLGSLYVSNIGGAQISFGNITFNGDLDFSSSNVNWNNTAVATTTFIKYSNLTLGSSMTITNSGGISIINNGRIYSTSNGKAITGNVTINTPTITSSEYSLDISDEFIVNGTLTLTAGRIYGYNLRVGVLSTSNSNTRYIEIIYDLTITGIGTVLSVTTQTGLTFITDTIRIAGTTSGNKTVVLSGVVACNVLYLQGSGTGTATFTVSLGVAIIPVIYIQKIGGFFAIQTSTIFGLYFLEGTTINWNSSASSVLTIQENLQLCNSMSVTASNPLVFNGGGVGNSQTFTTFNKTLTSTILINDPSGGNYTNLTVDGNYTSIVTSTAAIGITSASSASFNGPIQIPNGSISINGTATGAFPTVIFNSITQAINLSITSASLDLGNATLSGQLSLSLGNLQIYENSILNIFNFTSSFTTNVRDINLNNAIINLNGSGTIWNTGNGISQGVLTLNGNRATININDKFLNTCTIALGSAFIGNVNINRSNSSSNSSVFTTFTGLGNGHNNFRDFTILQSNSVHYITFQGTSVGTQTYIYDTFQVGNSTNRTVLQSSSVSTFFYLDKLNSGLVICPNVYIQLGSVYNPNTWYAISGSVDAGTFQWIFGNPRRRLGVGGAG